MWVADNRNEYVELSKTDPIGHKIYATGYNYYYDSNKFNSSDMPITIYIWPDCSTE